METTKTLTLLDIILVFIKYKKRIYLTTLGFLVISVILFFFVLDPIFLSEASIKSISKSSGFLGGLDIPNMENIEDFELGGGKSSKELASYEKILTSRRCIESLINKYNLMERGEFKYMQDAVKNFVDEKLTLKQEKMAGILNVGVYDKDPMLAKEMTEFLISELDKINIELNVQSAKNNREFIENRYFQAKEDLTKAEDSIKAFQIIYGIAPDLQIRAAAQSAFALEAELMTEEIKLDVLMKILSPDQIEVKTQQTKINSLREKIIGIQNSTDLSEFLRLGNSPQITMSFLRLQRELEIQTKILTFLLPLYEQAKIEEKRETPTIIILDSPKVAEKKSKPKRLTSVIIITFGGFIFSYIFFFGFDRWKVVKANIEYIKRELIKT